MSKLILAIPLALVLSGCGAHIEYGMLTEDADGVTGFHAGVKGEVLNKEVSVGVHGGYKDKVE